MNKVKTHLVDFIFKTSHNQQWIIFFRIAIGILALFHFIAILPDFMLLFSTNGIIPSDIMGVFVSDNVITLPKIIAFFQDFNIKESIVLRVFKILYISLSIFMIFGFVPRISALLLLILQISLLKGAPFYSYGVDFFMSMSLFYLILIPSDFAFSLKNHFCKRIGKINITSYLRLMQLHLSIAYFFSGLIKVLGFNWRNGEAIWKAINLPFANLDFQFDFTLISEYPILFIIIGWATITIELCYPLFIWWNKTRKSWLSLTISMHIGIALVLNLYFFSSIMIIWNLALFYIPYKTTVISNSININSVIK